MMALFDQELKWVYILARKLSEIFYFILANDLDHFSESSCTNDVVVIPNGTKAPTNINKSDLPSDSQ